MKDFEQNLKKINKYIKLWIQTSQIYLIVFEIWNKGETE